MKSLGNKPFPVQNPEIPGAHCDIPMGLFTHIEGSRVTFNWTAPHGNEGFLLKVTQVSTGTAYEFTVNGTSFVMSFAENSEYKWTVQTICNLLSNRKSIRATGEDFTTGSEIHPCFPIDYDSINVVQGINKVRIQWDTVNAMYGYNVVILDSRGYSVANVISATSVCYIDTTSFVLDKEYSVKIKAIGIDCPYSNPYSFVLVSNNKCTIDVFRVFKYAQEINLIWYSSIQNITYDVYLNNVLLIEKYQSNVLSLKNLEPGATYQLAVIPNCNGLGLGHFETITVDDLPVSGVENLKAVQNSKEITLSWDPVDSTVDLINLNIDGSYFAFEKNITQTTFVCEFGRKYHFEMYTTKQGQTSKRSVLEFQTAFECDRPSNVEYFPSHDQINIVFKKPQGCDKIKVEYKESGDTEYLSFETTLSNFLITGLNPSSTYQIVLYSFCNGIYTPGTGASINTKSLPLCKDLNNISVSNITSNSAFVSFEDPYFFNSDYVLRLSKVGDPDIVLISNETFFELKNLTADSSYSFIIDNNCGLSPKSSAAFTFNTLPFYAPVDVTGASAEWINGNADLQIDWDVVPDAEYIVSYRLITESSFISTAQQSGNSLVLSNLPLGIYEIKITTVYGTNQNEMSFYSGLPVLDAPVLVNNIDAEVVIQWQSVIGAIYLIMIDSIYDNIRRITSSTSEQFLLSLGINYVAKVKVINPITDLVGPESGILTFQTANTVSEKYCDTPVIEAFHQDSFINNPDVTINTKQDIIINIIDFNAAESYLINVYKKGEIVPLKTETLSGDSFMGTVVYKEIVNGKYEIEVSKFSNGKLVCKNKIASKQCK